MLSAVNDRAEIIFLSRKKKEKKSSIYKYKNKAAARSRLKNSAGFKVPAVTSSGLVHMCSLNNAGTNDTGNQSEGPAWLLRPGATTPLWEPLCVAFPGT